MAFCIYILDARRGTIYRDGFESGYLCRDGSLVSMTSDVLSDVLTFETIADANAEIKKRDLYEGFGVHAGRASAHVCCAS